MKEPQTPEESEPRRPARAISFPYLLNTPSNRNHNQKTSRPWLGIGCCRMERGGGRHGDGTGPQGVDVEIPPKKPTVLERFQADRFGHQGGKSAKHFFS